MTGREEPYLDMSDDEEEPYESSDEETQDWEEVDDEESAEEEPDDQSYQPNHLNAEAPESNEDTVSAPIPNDAGPQDDSMMSKQLAFILLGAAALTGLLGWVIYFQAFIPTAIVSVLTTSALLSIFRSLHAKRVLLHCILLVATFFTYLMVLFAFYPLWYRNFSSYSQELVTLAGQTSKKVSTGTKVDDKIASSSVQVVEATTTAVQGYLELSMGKRFRILLQMTLFSATLLILVLVIIGITPGLGTAHVGSPPTGFLAWFGPGAYRCVNGIGLFGLARILKALVICMVCGVGLRFAGFTSAPFIAGAVFCVALISYLSPAVALILGIFTAFTMDKVVISIVYLIGVCIVLSLAEKKLYWFLRLFPLLRRYLPERTEGTGAIGQTVGWVARAVPHVLSFAILAGIIFMGLEIKSVYEMNMERAKLVKEADNLMNETNDYKGAYDMYYDIAYNKYDGHPANIRLCHKMLECKLKAGRYQQAVASADILAEYDPAKPTEFKNPEKLDDVEESSTSVLKRFRYETAKLLADKAIKDHRADEGYELVIKEVHAMDMPTLLEDLGKKTLAINDENVWGYLAAARAALLQKRYADAIGYCRKGLGKKPNMIELLHVQASAHFAQGDYDDCINLTRKIMEYDPEDTDAMRLRVKASDAKNNAPEAPAPIEETNDGETDNAKDGEAADDAIKVDLPDEGK